MFISLIVEVDEQIRILVAAKNTLGKWLALKAIQSKVGCSWVVEIIQGITVIKVLSCVSSDPIWFYPQVPTPLSVIAEAFVDALLAVIRGIGKYSL